VYDYFAVEDYLNVVFENLFLISIITISYIVIGSILVLYVKIKAKAEALNVDPIKEGTKRGNITSKKSFRFLFIIAIVGTFIALINAFITKKITDIDGFILCLFSVLLSGSYLLLTDLDVSGLYKNSLPQRVLIVFLLLSVYFNFYLVFTKGVHLYISKSNNQKITFQFNSGKSITTSDSTLYLGNSKDYIFFFDRQKKKAFIYNKSTVNIIEKDK
jgi:hypothetical protein